MMSNLTFLYQQQDNYCPQSALFYISVSLTPDCTAFHNQFISSQNFGWHALGKSQSGYIDDPPSPPRFNKIPNPSFDECAVFEQDTAEGLARACRVISSWDCVRLKNTEFHTELARPAGTGRYWFSNRVERGGRKCSIQTREMKRGGHYVRRASRKEGQKGWVKKHWDLATETLSVSSSTPFFLWHLQLGDNFIPLQPFRMVLVS